MSDGFDLLGDPIPEGFGKRGRPPHVVTDEKRSLVIQLLAFDWTLDKIAAALSITPPTLRKNYLRELKSRAEARARVEAKLLTGLMTGVEAGNPSSIEKYFKRLDKHDLAALAAKVADRGEQDEDEQLPIGKKEAKKLAAGKVEGIFAPPEPPGRKFDA